MFAVITKTVQIVFHQKMNNMKLLLKRIALKDTYTIGKLYIDGEYFCDTLEDRVRDYNKDGDLMDAGETKIFGETAIPYGKYKMNLSLSPKFKKILPRLLNVPHFDGILIHAGTKAEHSHGCILIGKNTVVGGLSQSREYQDKLIVKLRTAVHLEIEIK